MAEARALTGGRLGVRLGALRDRYFVGRAAELALFGQALEGERVDRPIALLFVHGPGGVGKSVLLRELGRRADAAGATVVALDGRDLEPSPAGFVGALRAALGLAHGESPLEALAAQAARPVLL